MAFYQFSKADVVGIKEKFPKLDLIGNGRWEGIIELYAEFDGEALNDSFGVAIETGVDFPNKIPALFETGGRTQVIAKKHRISNVCDLHYNAGNGSACVCVKQEERLRFPPGSGLLTFINDLVIPYLYGLSYFDKYGRWPWKEYSHGSLGLLEFYAGDGAEQTERTIEEIAENIRKDVNWKEYCKQIRKPSSEGMCICGSRRPFQKCHDRAWRGVVRLNTDIKRLNLNPRRLLEK